ncbi:hypothetical protein V6N13_025525 [Hibiscus sabdariffa]
MVILMRFIGKTEFLHGLTMTKVVISLKKRGNLKDILAVSGRFNFRIGGFSLNLRNPKVIPFPIDSWHQIPENTRFGIQVGIGITTTGTPEFPDLGRHCSLQHCKQIDFLPFTCDRCNLCYCLEHRSYIEHQCPKANNNDVTVVICPICAKGVRLVPDKDPNISWETHVNTDCDPSNYAKVTKKKKCPVPRCREVLALSNTIKCRDCGVDHCLKHRFGLDHNCSAHRKLDPGVPTTSLSSWATRFLNLASSFGENQQSTRDRAAPRRGNGGGKAEECPQCGVKFSSGTTLVEHVKKVHEKNNDQSRVVKMSIDVCPKCSKGFRDPVALVEHVERDHGGTSRA